MKPAEMCTFGAVAATRSDRRRTGRTDLSVLLLPGTTDEFGFFRWDRRVPLTDDQLMTLVKETPGLDTYDPRWTRTIMRAFHDEWLAQVAAVATTALADDEVMPLPDADPEEGPAVDREQPSPDPVLLDIAALVAAPVGPPPALAPGSTSEARRQ